METANITATISPCLTYENANAAIDWLCRAFGFTLQFAVKHDNGDIGHSELSLGNGVIMVSSVKVGSKRLSPQQLDGNSTQAFSVYVADPDAHYNQAVKEGANIIQPLRDEEYGARGYMATDLEGYQWYFGNYQPGAYWQQS